MKKLITFLAFGLFVAFNLAAQSGINWSAPIAVSSSSQGDDSPRIALLADDTPVALWGHTGKIYFSRMLDENSFTEPAQISTNGVQPSIYNFGGLGLTTYGDQVYLVFENFQDGVFFIRSTDGGNNFDLPVSVLDPAPGLWATLPSVGTDHEGNPLVSVILENTNETEGRYVMMRSIDGGQTFGPPVIANEPADGEYVCECCLSDIVSQNENVYLIYRNNDNNLRDMWVSRSTDGGNTFDAATDVDDTDWILNSCPISGPRINTLGTDSLITTWMSGASGDARVSFSTLHGGTMEKGWEKEIPLMNAGAVQSGPDVAGQNDTIGIVWEESGFGINGIDLMFAFSKNGTADLVSNMANITDVIGGQRRPSLTYANGFFHLIYTDGTGGLAYRKGAVSEISPTFEREQPQIRIVPQPISNGIIQIQFPASFEENCDFRLFSAAGRMMRQWPNFQVSGSQSTNLPIGAMETGVYFLEITSPTNKVVKKVLFKN